MRRLTFLLLCLFIGIGVATAQTMKITGNVISSEDQQPVIGAAVVVKGTTIGTVTDFEGNFSLDVPRDAKMIFISYVGLKTENEGSTCGIRDQRCFGLGFKSVG